MLLSSWSMKLSSSPLNNLACLIQLDENSVIYQSAGKKLFVQKNNLSIPLPIQKQISALEIFTYNKKNIVLTISNNNLSAYDILQNHQNFYVEFDIAQMLHVATDSIFVAGGSDIYCLDFKGVQNYNNHLPANIMQVHTFQQFSYIALEDKSVKIYKQLSLLYDYSNLPNIPVCLCPIIKNTVVVGFKQGMIATYESKKSKWKAKSKHLPIKILLCQIQTMKEKSIIVGRQDGQIEIRNWVDGVNISKMSMQESLCQIYLYDFRKQNKQQLIFISKEGTLKAFNLVEKLQKQSNLIGQEKTQELNEVQELTNKKKMLQIQIIDIKKNLSGQQTNQQNKQILKENFEINWSFLNKNKLMLIANCKNGYIRGIYFQEQLAPYFIKPAEKLVYEFEKACNHIGALNIKALVSSYPNNEFEIKTLILNLPKFWRWSYTANANIKQPQSLIAFKIRQRLARYVKWLNQSFVLCLSQQQLNKWQDKTSLNIVFFNSYQNLYLRINVDANNSNVQFRCEDLSTLGQLIQDLAEYMNIKELESEGKFPNEMSKLKQKLIKIQEINKNKTSISSQIAQAINTVKYMIVRGQNSRVTYNMKQMRKVYTEIMQQNHKLFIEMKKKNQNSILLNELLKDLGQMISKTSNLRLGTARTRTTNLCRNAFKNKQFIRLLNIMEKGSQ